MSAATPPAGGRPSAWPLWVLGGLSCLIYGVGFELVLPLSWLYLCLFYPLALLGGAACLWVWRHPGLPVSPILAFALLFRVLALGDAPSLSSDVYRYSWDGLVQRAGVSPYAHPPEAEELASLRDAEIHPRINRPWARTVYPPGAQLLFAAIPYDLNAVRLSMVLLDCLTLWLIVCLLGALGLDPARVILYAWCPFVVYEIANNGHLEAAVLPLLIGAVLAVRRGGHRLAGLLLGGAVSLKLYPALAAVALARDRPWRVIVPAGVSLGSLYVLYGVAAGGDILGFLPRYVGSAEDHNIGLRRLFEAGLRPLGVPQPRLLAFLLCLGLVAALCVLLWRRGDQPLERRMLAITGGWILLLPTALHPWYALWIVPWLCVLPRASWLWLIGTLPLSYLKYDSPGGVMPAWIVPIELLPTAGFLLIEGWRDRCSRCC